MSIGKGTQIIGDCLIRGPVVIGEDCVIANSYIGPYTAIGSRSIIRGAEIEHSIVFPEVVVTTSKRITSSLLGSRVSLLEPELSQPKTGHRLVVGENSVVEL